MQEVDDRQLDWPMGYNSLGAWPRRPPRASSCSYHPEAVLQHVPLWSPGKNASTSRCCTVESTDREPAGLNAPAESRRDGVVSFIHALMQTVEPAAGDLFGCTPRFGVRSSSASHSVLMTSTEIAPGCGIQPRPAKYRRCTV